MADANSGGGGPVPTGLDLFGQPIQPIRDRRGRPSYKKDKENQTFVSARAAAGWTHKAIADNMGIDEKTLRKHFSRELTDGAIHIRGMIIDVLVHRAQEGHVPSIRLLREILDEAGPVAPRNHAGREPEGDEDGEEEPKASVGKKEQRILDAQSVPDDYGDILQRIERRH